MRLHPSASLFALLTVVGACSIINAPDDVVTEATAGTSSTGGKDSNGGTDSNGGVGNEATGGEMPTPTAGAGGDATGTGGDGPIDVDPGVGPNPTTGLVVLGTEDDKGARYLTALNPRTGKEISSEKLPVAAVAYDEAAGHHAWFVFTAGAFPASPTGAADFEVRRLNDATGKWFVAGRTTALPPPQPDQLVVLNDRLAYLSHRVVGGKAVTALTVLDTTDLKNVTEVDSLTAEAGEVFVGLTGDRGSDVNANAPGGRLRLMVASGCTATDCALDARQIFVGDSITAGTSVAIDRYTGQPRFAKARSEDKLFVALRSTSGTSRLLIRSYTGPDLKSPTNYTINDFMGDNVGGFTLAECGSGGVITDVVGNQLIAFHLVSGTQHVVDLVTPGGPVYTEPFAPSVIALDSTTAPGLRAFEVAKSGTMNVAMNERSIWQPNGTFKPLTGATRRGEAFKCP
ncbi:MAG TPA: hypothetical protein VHP33_27900 [Polyangiaceae bacterium]|nr:hypothetical protein [Polyangiaceae bacterium]